MLSITDFIVRVMGHIFAQQNDFTCRKLKKRPEEVRYVESGLVGRGTFEHLRVGDRNYTYMYMCMYTYDYVYNYCCIGE
jgi:hypothetical protein